MKDCINAQIAMDMESAINCGMNKQAFLKLVDTKKYQIYGRFASAYTEPYAKLMALKIVNLIVGKYHYINRHTTIASRPIELMIDPSNACQLDCPNCVHSSSPQAKAAKYFELYWPPGMLSCEQYEKVLHLYGPFAFGAVLYNYGEPLLNPQTPKYIAMARQYLLFTLLSTNLSLGKIDVDALVTSGLNHMILSIDGVTQQSYETYRKHGKLDLVFDNLRKLIDTKKKFGLKTPYLVWQFLTFEHNVHEVDDALELAESMGVDAIHILTPNDVSADDPRCILARSSKEGYHYFTPYSTLVASVSDSSSDLATGPHIDKLFNESLVARMRMIGGIDEASRTGPSGCGWLYKNISIDGLGRIMPCCDAPSEYRNLVYGDLQDTNNDYWNSPGFVLSRLSLSDKQAFFRQSPENAPYCGECPSPSEPPHDLWRVAQSLPFLDKEEVIPTMCREWLTSWRPGRSSGTFMKLWDRL
ncbi:MAG: SPASM domain-containing protein [bacterium]|uniref:SPASM domain-containing protein n=1 Tax=Candidatus Methylomirabilis tolerans TaxID=3123416 RepID=A0AAJ1AHK6_9BACT|nr:SPASM domain-containing protein [Candidatus Methylomirabilis sp.]